MYGRIRLIKPHGGSKYYSLEEFTLDVKFVHKTFFYVRLFYMHVISNQNIREANFRILCQKKTFFGMILFQRAINQRLKNQTLYRSNTFTIYLGNKMDFFSVGYHHLRK